MATLDKPRVFYGHFEDLPVLALKGQVRYMNAQAIRGALDDLLAHTSDDPIIIDLRELEAIDSTGLGLLAHVGRATLERGHRSAIVCSVHDTLTCLRSVAFDTLFHILEDWPFSAEAEVTEVQLDEHTPAPAVMGRFMLEAHWDLAGLSEENRRSFSGVISALESDLDVRHPGGP